MKTMRWFIAVLICAARFGCLHLARVTGPGGETTDVQERPRADPALVAKLQAMIPNDLRWAGENKAAYDRGERFIAVMNNFDFRMNRPPRGPSIPKGPYLARLPGKSLHESDVQKVRDLFAEGDVDYPVLHHNGPVIKKYALALEGSRLVFDTMLRTAIDEADAGKSAESAKDFLVCIQMADTGVPWMQQIGLQWNTIFKYLAQMGNENRINSYAWKLLLKTIPPATEPDPVLQEQIRSWLATSAEQIASIKPRGGDLRDDSGRIRKTLKPCGTIDYVETMQDLIKIEEMHMGNSLKPYPQLDNRALTYAKAFGVGLPQFPIPARDSGWVHRNPNFDAEYAAYATKMDDGHNTLGREFLMNQGYPGIFEESAYRRTTLEMDRGFAAIQIFRLANGRMPRNWGELVAGGILAQPPHDFFAEAPLHYNPTLQRIWSVGPDGTDGGGVGQAAGDLATGDPKQDFDWIFSWAPEKAKFGR